MPILKSLPTVQEFKIVDESIGLPADDPIIIRVRQASEGETLEHDNLLPRALHRDYTAQTDQIPFTPASLRRAVEAYLALTYCNVQEKVSPDSEETRPVFPSVSSGGVERLTVRTFDEFLKKWKGMNPEWAVAIHLCVLAVNLQWAQETVVNQEDFFALFPAVEDWMRGTGNGKSDASPESTSSTSKDSESE